MFFKLTYLSFIVDAIWWHNFATATRCRACCKKHNWYAIFLDHAMCKCLHIIFFLLGAHLVACKKIIMFEKKAKFVRFYHFVGSDGIWNWHWFLNLIKAVKGKGFVFQMQNDWTQNVNFSWLIYLQSNKRLEIHNKFSFNQTFLICFSIRNYYF